MRELLVLRHAKSRWDEPDTEDHDRGLAPRGISAAKRAGRLLAEQGWRPDRILCSSARRTRETLDLAREAWPEEPPIATQILPSLYLATPSRLLDTIRRQPENATRLLLIGHNPGLQSFVLRLTGHGDRAARLAIEEKFPTAGIARLTFDIPSWRELEWSKGVLAFYDRPPKA